MRVRSVTIGIDAEYPLNVGRFEGLGAFQRQAREQFEEAGLEVQTVRVATQPFPMVLGGQGASEAPAFAQALEALCQRQGIDYCSIGPVAATSPESDLSYIDVIPDLIRQTETAFASVLVASNASGINLEAIAKCAGIIAEVAQVTPDGFGNLRLAVLANCGPGSPFFPVSYHEGPETRFSIATEAADLAVEAFSQAQDLEEARLNLKQAIGQRAEVIEDVCRTLEAGSGFRYGGIDFSLAPFPETARSIGHAIERLGVERFGRSATLFAVAFIKQAIREATFTRCGFCGVMLPVLEDRTLADRSVEHLLTLDGLLLYSTVCGTGLDTIPLPGGVAVEELAAILLDVAVLSLATDKPLTARLMPIPGKGAGEMTEFDFPYFANAQIMDVRGRGAPRIFEENAFLHTAFDG
jgi:uncharacterized protein (UPF0210 family)